MPPSVARDRFDRIVQAPDPVAVLRGMVNSDPPTYEDDWFDCKREPTDSNDPKKREAKAKKMWLQALSGFANNEGGVLVWGLDARKKGKEIDQVIGEEPVNEPLGLKSKLTEWRRDATDPPLGNVQIEAYEHPAGSGKGFVVCYVPEGPHKPYRTREGDESQWYLRTSDNFAVMSPAILRAMFYPRASAVFHLEVDLSWVFVEGDRPQHRHDILMTLDVRIANSGRATAKDVLLRVEPFDEVRFSVVGLGNDWRREGHYFRTLWALHPSVPSSVVFSLQWGAVARPGIGHRVGPIGPDPEFKFAIYCENQEPQYFEAKFRMLELNLQQRLTVEASPRDPF